jgi:hypothetical protein
MQDQLNIRPMGHVKQIVDGKVIREGHNLIVDSALEVMLQGLFGGSKITQVAFGNSGGDGISVPSISPSMRTIPVTPNGATALIGQLPDTQSYASLDSRGIRSIGTFIAILKVLGNNNFTYDTLGLTSNTGLLFAVTSFLPVTLTPGQSVSVQWSVLLRG